jgi:hypothetical protein
MNNSKTVLNSVVFSAGVLSKNNSHTNFDYLAFKGFDFP